MKKILIINGHPSSESFCKSLAESYCSGAGKAGSQAWIIHLGEITFNPILKYGYHKRTELEPELLEIQRKIREADHLVFVYPTWWGTFPALLKGFFDRVFIPGFAFKYRENSVFWDKLLKGKSARLITTMDAPAWYYRFVYKSPGYHALKKATLNFCGISPVKTTSYQIIKTSSPAQREKWLAHAFLLGEKDSK